MVINQAIKTMLQGSNKKRIEAATHIGITPASFTVWMSKQNQIERLIKLASFCGCKIIITNEKDINITLSNETNESSQ